VPAPKALCVCMCVCVLAASRQMPLAVVVDDRTVVWEPHSRSHILQVRYWYGSGACAQGWCAPVSSER